MTIEFRPFNVKCDPKYARMLHTGELTFDTIMAEPNVECRRALSQLVGLDSQISPPVAQDEEASLHTTPAGGLFMRLVDPSTGRVYIHPTVDDRSLPPKVHRAMRWTVWVCDDCAKLVRFDTLHPTAKDTGPCERCGRKGSPRRYMSQFDPVQES